MVRVSSEHHNFNKKLKFFILNRLEFCNVLDPFILNLDPDTVYFPNLYPNKGPDLDSKKNVNAFKNLFYYI